jgi:hypothetical protein
MTALWRVWARLAVGSAPQAANLAALALAPALVRCLVPFDALATRGRTGELALFAGLLLGVPLLAGWTVQGRALGPTGKEVLGAPFPALPVTPRTRTIAAALFGGAVLVGGTAVVGSILWALVGQAALGNPFAGVGIAPASLPRALAVQALGYAPLLVVGAQASGHFRPRAFTLAAAVLVALGALGVGQDLLPSALFSAFGLPFALRPRRSGARREPARFRPLGSGLLGVLGGVAMMTTGMAAIGSALMIVIPWSAGVRDAVFAPVTGAYLVCLLPLVPASMAGGAVLASSPDALLRLPVSRARVYTTLFGLGVARGVLTGTVVTLLLLVLGIHPTGEAVISTLLVGAASGAITPPLLLRAGSRAGGKLLAIAVAVVPFGLATLTAGGHASIVWLVGVTLVCLAVGAGVTRATIKAR